jgi:uncharacterized protein (TIGR03663 family)
VATASTKSRNTKERATRSSSGAAKLGPPGSEVVSAAPLSKLQWRSSAFVILVLGAFLRIYNLNLVPLHHDEGVNGNFLVRLVREGYYHYDPGNYHGPTLYYITAAFPWLLRLLAGPDAQNKYGLTTPVIRLMPALFGVATIALIFALRRNLGGIATLAAALLLAISPGAVYLSRYFIHETLFVFFTFGIVVALVKYGETYQPIYPTLAALCAALLFATKETAMISAGVLLIAFVITRLYPSLFRSLAGSKKKRSTAEPDYRTFVEKAGGPITLTVSLTVAAVVFIVVYVLFYSSFFTNYPQGIDDSLKTFQIWSKTGKEAHVHPFITYVWWLLEQESPLLALGTFGAVLAVLKPQKRFALFSALWAFGLLAAYSLIAYKTPWLALNFILPLALTAGVTFEWIYDELQRWEVAQSGRWLILAAILLIAIGPLPGLTRIFDEVIGNSKGPVAAMSETPVHAKTFIPGYQTVDLNFINYDNDNRYYVYVYAHTRRETLKLVSEINRIAEKTHAGANTGITIVSPDYWPLPWYLRDYKRVGYHGHMTPSNEPLIIAKQEQAVEVQTTFGDRYQQIRSEFNPNGSFSLRPGVDLLLYTRRELMP